MGLETQRLRMGTFVLRSWVSCGRLWPPDCEFVFAVRLALLNSLLAYPTVTDRKPTSTCRLE